MRLAYPIDLSRQSVEDGGGWLVTFPDWRNAVTDGASLQEALVNAGDCLATMIDYCLRKGEEIPTPSPAGNRRTHRAGTRSRAQGGPLAGAARAACQPSRAGHQVGRHLAPTSAAPSQSTTQGSTRAHPSRPRRARQARGCRGAGRRLTLGGLLQPVRQRGERRRLLQRPAHLEHGRLVPGPADHLQPERQAGGVEPGGHR